MKVNFLPLILGTSRNYKFIITIIIDKKCKSLFMSSLTEQHQFRQTDGCLKLFPSLQAKIFLHEFAHNHNCIQLLIFYWSLWSKLRYLYPDHDCNCRNIVFVDP